MGKIIMDIRIFDGDRGILMPLFASADHSLLQIYRYIDLGEVLVARDDGEILGHLQIVETDQAGVLELKSMAVVASRQREGMGGALVEAAVIRCRGRKGRRLIVSTATADIDNLRFYQRHGFRMYKIVQDAFTTLRGYPEDVLVDGIPLCDQVFLELDLAER
jgi:GNAT superfamily N-acetyltransferase